MTDYTLRRTVARPYEDTVEAVRAQLGEAGFGVLTEIGSKAEAAAGGDLQRLLTWVGVGRRLRWVASAACRR